MQRNLLAYQISKQLKVKAAQMLLNDRDVKEWYPKYVKFIDLANMWLEINALLKNKWIENNSKFHIKYLGPSEWGEYYYDDDQPIG